MLKSLSFVPVGLGGAIAIAFWVMPSADDSVEAEAARGADPAARSISSSAGLAEARLEALEQAFAAEVDQRVELEARVAELSAQLEALGQRPPFPRDAANAAAGPDGGPPPNIREQRAREQ